MIAPMPTAPIGAANPSCPTTAVSTAPSSGIVAFEITMGTAIPSTRRWVIGAGVTGADPGTSCWQAFLSGSRGDPAAKAAGRTRLLRPKGRSAASSLRHRRSASGNGRWPGRRGARGCPAMPRRARWRSGGPAVDPGAGVGVAGQAGAQVVDGEVDGLGQGGKRPASMAAAASPPPSMRSQTCAQASSMMAVISRKAPVAPPCSAGRQRVADQLVGVGKLCRQLVAAPVEDDAELADVGNRRHHTGECCVAALLQHLNRFRAGHQRPGSTVNAALAVGDRFVRRSRSRPPPGRRRRCA